MNTAELSQYCREKVGIGFPWLIVIAVYILVAVGASWWLWDFLSKGEPSSSATIRNLVLIWGAPLATVLAVWRSMVAQRQSEIAQRSSLADRYQRTVEMLGHSLDSLRIGGIHALVDLAREHPDEYQRRVVRLLQVYYEPEEPLNKIQATLIDAFHTILGAKKAQAVLLEFDQIRLRNSRKK